MGIAAHMHDFGKNMLVCAMTFEKPHHFAAWEWFGYGQTLALLPMNPHPVTGAQCLQHGAGGGHAGGKQQRLAAAFQLGQQLLDAIVGRALVARIHPPARIAALGVAGEGGGQVQRRGHIVKRRAWRFAAMGGVGGGVQGISHG